MTNASALLTAANTQAAGPDPEALSPEAEAARIGALARRKERREAAAETAALVESVKTGRRIYWQRKNRGRPVLMSADGDRYSDHGLAELCDRAARMAAASARKGRLVKGGKRVGRMTLTDTETAALAAEAAALVLACQASAAATGPESYAATIDSQTAHTGRPNQALRRLPRMGATAEALNLPTDGRPAAERDLAALVGGLLNLCRSDQRQGWRDAAEALASGTGQDVSTLAATGDLEAAAAGLAEAKQSPNRPSDPGRSWPLSPDTQATLYLSGLPRRQRVALAAALTGDRATAADWAILRDRSGAASIGAWHKAASLGRSQLRAALVNPETRATTAAAVAAAAEAENGRRSEADAIREVMAEASPSGPVAAARAVRLTRQSIDTDRALRMARVYCDPCSGPSERQRLAAELTAARRAAAEIADHLAATEEQDQTEAERLTWLTARERVADLARQSRRLTLTA